MPQHLSENAIKKSMASVLVLPKSPVRLYPWAILQTRNINKSSIEENITELKKDGDLFLEKFQKYGDSSEKLEKVHKKRREHRKKEESMQSSSQADEKNDHRSIGRNDNDLSVYNKC